MQETKVIINATKPAALILIGYSNDEFNRS